jgi:hypothetical protein
MGEWRVVESGETRGGEGRGTDEDELETERGNEERGLLKIPRSPRSPDSRNI